MWLLIKGKTQITHQALLWSFNSKKHNNKKCWQKFPEEKDNSK
jgi:hypothetical protein